MMMVGWESAWNDIMQGGSPRWKVDDPHIKEQALDRIVQYCWERNNNNNNSNNNNEPSITTKVTTDPQPYPLLNIFCPLAGDDSFVTTAWRKGHSVTTIDIVPAAVALLRKQINDNAIMSDDDDDEKKNTKKSSDMIWTETTTLPNSVVVWTHSSQRATFYIGNALESIAELHNTFDAVYDKDAFGALDTAMRSLYCLRIAEYLKPGGIVYLEVKNKPTGPDQTLGPPFHVEPSDLMESFGPQFEYVANLGNLYELTAMPHYLQMGHILMKKL